MRKGKMVAAALVVTGVFASLEYTSIAQPTQPAPPTRPTPPTQPALPNRATISPLDRQFIIDAAQGGMAEVSLGQMASQRATNNAVKQYGQRMVQEHTRANTELLRLASQKGVTPPRDMGPKYRAAMDRLMQLPRASFDQAYISEAGINGHLESLAVYQRQAQLGQDPDLKAFAVKTLPIVQNHLQVAGNLKANNGAENRRGRNDSDDQRGRSGSEDHNRRGGSTR